ncbi:MAG: helix-turn-helix domain-containing protein [Azonexus sp.]|uniref:helix-turn-helix domain-containing protein n=1 Tax=Azonexus sp. TaxID=1872668 RepID=UPI00281A7124|nr:helix-turn-helix transcriptional regulator [Azonexus sp.]MDR0775903.1 helix-turn-helix domain-containing protein [Azonexus sp.]
MAKRTRTTSQGDWHPADIKAELDKAGWTIRSLAVHHGISATSVSHAFVRSYPLNEQRIADAIGVTPQVIWPSRYNTDGSKKPRGMRALRLKSTQVRCQHNGNLQQAV